MPRWGKPYRDKRDWKKYNEQLVVRGEFLLDLDFADRWFSEIGEMCETFQDEPIKKGRTVCFSRFRCAVAVGLEAAG